MTQMPELATPNSAVGIGVKNMGATGIVGVISGFYRDNFNGMKMETTIVIL